MKSQDKQHQLRRYKMIATGLLLLMAVVYVASFFVYKASPLTGFARAFAEAAMVGALADWFAVTALFRHPLGLPVPHTNLIEANKVTIGNNLGQFVAENFLTAETIRPRIEKLRVARKLGQWLDRPQNRGLIVQELTRIIAEALEQADDRHMTAFISRQVRALTEQLPTGKIAGDALEGLLEHRLHEEWLSRLAENAAQYIAENQNFIKEKVSAESYKLIPGFIDDLIAAKITKGLRNYLLDLAADPHHPQRQVINQKLRQWAVDMKTSPQWAGRFQSLKDYLLPEGKLNNYSEKTWQYFKNHLKNNLSETGSDVQKYLNKTLVDISEQYLRNASKAGKLDNFIQVQAFRLIMRHKTAAAQLISSTVGQWESRALSQKLETEVGKDLQFIRFNGTLVGGLVGLVIHTLGYFLH
ncbi:MAG TPA: DUF445 domain-containing protein [Edaphocola sp.]|nr:DUF445 domain-containing protein [Edaphocola sp.]